jgi:hypothetical protein
MDIAKGIARSMTQRVTEFERKLQIGRRDRFIAAALTGLCVNQTEFIDPTGEREIATKALRIADILLEIDWSEKTKIGAEHESENS